FLLAGVVSNSRHMRYAASCLRARLLDRVSQAGDFAGDVRAQKLESRNGGECNQSSRYCVFRKFEPCLIAKKSLDHCSCAPYVVSVYSSALLRSHLARGRGPL